MKDKIKEYEENNKTVIGDLAALTGLIRDMQDSMPFIIYSNVVLGTIFFKYG